MNTLTATSSAATARAAHGAAALTTAPAARLTKAAERALRLLERLPRGQLELQLPSGQNRSLPSTAPAAEGQRAALNVHDWAVFQRVLSGGDIGLAEAYIEGQCDSPDLVALLGLCLDNRSHIEGLIYGRWWGRLLPMLRHFSRRNTRAGSSKNIHAHYDLGNDFYQQWLDPSMSYSAAWFEGRQPTAQGLQAAQQAKVRRALRQSGIQPGQRLLEVGCGWGALAQQAATEFGAQVKGITLSPAQLSWGQRSVASRGLSGQIELALQDYRDLPAAHQNAPFDAIVSIEMFEAVGHEYWAGYFKALHASLKPGGRACIQSITIRDDLFARYVRGTDFIQQYIFPGGLLPSPSAFEAQAKQAGFELEARFAFGQDYAQTLKLWREAFTRESAGVQALGFDARFLRIWTFYLAYCEAAFRAGNTDVMQFTLRKPHGPGRKAGT